MGVNQLDDVEQDDAPDPTPVDSVVSDGSDPFVMGYDFDDWEFDAESTNLALSLVIAVTNLL